MLPHAEHTVGRDRHQRNTHFAGCLDGIADRFPALLSLRRAVGEFDEALMIQQIEIDAGQLDPGFFSSLQIILLNSRIRQRERILPAQIQTEAFILYKSVILGMGLQVAAAVCDLDSRKARVLCHFHGKAAPDGEAVLTGAELVTAHNIPPDCITCPRWSRWVR